MNWAPVFQHFEEFFVIYFLMLQASYLTLNFFSVVFVWHYMRQHTPAVDVDINTGLEPPVSLLVAVKNEQAMIVDSVNALLQLEYGEYEVIVINDGSTDDTLSLLKSHFALAEFPDASQKRLNTKHVHAFYQSTRYPNLKVIDKDNGGKADALNAGMSAAIYPLFCSVDADSILQRDSLRRVVMPFIEDQRTIAAGGTVRVANSCVVEEGFMVKTGLSTRPLVLMQVMEYLRAFLFGRLGWAPLNALLVISGTFGVFHRETVIAAGGYRTDTVGEDMELVVRLHRILKKQGKPYRITFVPDPICWTEVPSDLKTLRRQRVRWQQGLMQSLWMNRGLLFNPRGGAAGWLAFPFMLLFECIGPIIEVLGYAYFVLGAALGYVALDTASLFFVVAVGMGMLLSVMALLIEEMSFHIYVQPKQLMSLLFAALIENLGYRQLGALWRFGGIVRYFFGGTHWHQVTRTKSWEANTRESPIP